MCACLNSQLICSNPTSYKDRCFFDAGSVVARRHMTKGRNGIERRTLARGAAMPWRHTFQTRIAGVLALLLLLVVTATYFAVKAATSRAMENQARVQLKTGAQVFERLLDLRGRR